MLYGYDFYLFAARFNEAFLLYAAIVALSALTIGLLLAGLDAAALAQQFAASTPVRGISTYMLVLALGLAFAWTAQSLVFVAGGELPGIVRDTGHPTSVVFALDLTIVVPTLVLGAVLLPRPASVGLCAGPDPHDQGRHLCARAARHGGRPSGPQASRTHGRSRPSRSCS